jgi:hypothetical protein
MMGTIRLLVVAAIVLLSLPGCAATPTQRWAQARETLTATQDTTLTLYDAGLVTKDQLIAMDPYVRSVRVALAVAETDLPDGGNGFDSQLEAAQAALAELRKLQRSVATVPTSGVPPDP